VCGTGGGMDEGISGMTGGAMKAGVIKPASGTGVMSCGNAVNAEGRRGELAYGSSSIGTGSTSISSSEDSAPSVGTGIVNSTISACVVTLRCGGMKGGTSSLVPGTVGGTCPWRKADGLDGCDEGTGTVSSRSLLPDTDVGCASEDGAGTVSSRRGALGSPLLGSDAVGSGAVSSFVSCAGENVGDDGADGTGVVGDAGTGAEDSATTVAG
jgi:hypothetical protein